MTLLTKYCYGLTQFVWNKDVQRIEQISYIAYNTGNEFSYEKMSKKVAYKRYTEKVPGIPGSGFLNQGIKQS